MVDSGYNLIGFLGVSAGKLEEAFFIGLDGAVRKAASALAGSYFCLIYFRHWIRMRSIVIRLVASDHSFVKGFTEVTEIARYKSAQLMCDQRERLPVTMCLLIAQRE